jgi:hypothetical protein
MDLELPFGDVMRWANVRVLYSLEVAGGAHWPIVFALVPEQPNKTGFV